MTILLQKHFIEKLVSFSWSIVKVKLPDNKYNGGQYFFQKYIRFSDDSCMIFQKSKYVYLAC